MALVLYTLYRSIVNHTANSTPHPNQQSAYGFVVATKNMTAAKIFNKRIQRIPGSGSPDEFLKPLFQTSHKVAGNLFLRRLGCLLFAVYEAICSVISSAGSISGAFLFLPMDVLFDLTSLAVVFLDGSLIDGPRGAADEAQKRF
ncbi:hypothetical protein HPB51_024220 [Rhipicephalus microplus]|uniref:Uncharacterized protein n=1 Tax=Rhipicephalus microplus TaxID=6941 RepID=A0A9J6DXV7_RHIMP|nr:hypothetical protein HPB51_024220 [Rhipicephalus microplus]